MQVHIDKYGHSFDILPQQAYDFIHPAVVRLITLSSNPVLVYFGTLAQRHPVSARALKRVLHNTDAERFLDINLRPPWYDEKTIQHSLQDANIVKLNDEELHVVAQMFGLTGDDTQCQAIELMKRFGLDQIIVTLGEAGAWHMNKNGKCEVGEKIQAQSWLIQ